MTCSYRPPARPNSNVFSVKWEVQADKDNDTWVRLFFWIVLKTDCTMTCLGRMKANAIVSYSLTSSPFYNDLHFSLDSLNVCVNRYFNGLGFFLTTDIQYSKG